jgi:hypothetical protein
VVLLAGGDAAVVQDQIVAAAHLLQALRERGALVAQDAEIADLAAEPAQHRHQHEAVGIEQLRRAARSPGDTSSLPVENTATRMRLTTSSCVRPKAAASATSCGRSRWPAFSAAWPSGMSSPAGAHWRRLQPCRQHDLAALDADVFLHEHGVGASGIGAPVKMRTAWRGLIGARPTRGLHAASTGKASASCFGRSRLAGPRSHQRRS